MNIPKHRLLEFTNLVNEACIVLGSENVSEWINLPNKNFEMETPMDVFNNGNTDKIYDLLRFIEIDEADIC